MTTDPSFPDAEQLLDAIKGNVYRLTTTTHHEYRRETAPLESVSSRQRIPTVKATAYVEPLITELRNAIRPDQGRTDSGRGGKSALPFDAAASELLGSIEAEIAGMYRSALEREPIGTSEQLLLEWFTEFDAAHRAGDIILTQLVTQLRRVRGWRFAIEDHFDPPSRIPGTLCPRCGYAEYLTRIDGEIIPQPCIVVLKWPSNPRRAPIAECRHCARQGITDSRWLGMEGLRELNAEVEANIRQYGPLERPLAPLPEDDDTPTPEEPTP